MYKTHAEAVKEWLQAYRANEEYIDRQVERLRTLKARMMNVGAQKLTDMPRVPSKTMDPMADYVIQVEKLEQAIQSATEIQNQCRDTILAVLDRLDKDEEKLIIRYRYLYGYEWNDVMDKIYRDNLKFSQKMESYRRRMYRTHEDALKNMAKNWNSDKK